MKDKISKKEYMRQYYIDNREKVLETNKRWNKNNPEKMKGYYKKWKDKQIYEKIINKEEYIKSNEGLRLKPYKCSSGKLTIGYGRNLENNGITKEEAEILLYNDIKRIHEFFNKYLTYYPSLPDEYKTVILDMAYNMGISGLMGFKNMLYEMQQRNKEGIIKEIRDSKYYKQLQSRAERNISLIMGDAADG